MPVVTTAQFVELLKARAPNGASVDFTSVKMGDRADLCGTELGFPVTRERGLTRVG